MGARQDENSYRSWEDTPELGSIRRVSTEKNGVAHYQCLSADIGKLPDYAIIGSDCLVIDTSEVYVKHDQWRKL